MNATALGLRAEAMLNTLGAISDDPARLTRLFLSPAHARAIALVKSWMADAGLTVRVDALGTVHGMLPGARSRGGERRLLLGSHIDTVVEAGKYDGALGVVAAIIAADELRKRGMALPFALEVLAFGDEEGVRFPKTLTSSQAIAGAMPPDALDAADASGTTLRQALIAFGRDPARIVDERLRPGDVLGYLEVHIEQGPVLEREHEALGVVSAIAGQGRYRVRVDGEAGHAGTVPMALRRDALAAAAEMILAVEAVARKDGPGLVATVGHIEARPGAGNVIPGGASFSLDLRASEDRARAAALAGIRARVAEIAAARRVTTTMETLHEKPVTLASPSLTRAIARSVTRVTGREPRVLMSGAGHDGQAIAALTGIGMIFVRCRGGVSHNPAEYASPADVGLAIEALIGTIGELAASASGAG